MDLIEGVAFEKQAVALHETLYKSFKYSCKEFVVLEDLVKQREVASSIFYKNYFELEARKDKVIGTGQLGTTPINTKLASDIPKEDLMKNKLVAKFLMFPDVILTSQLYRTTKSSKRCRSSSGI